MEEWAVAAVYTAAALASAAAATVVVLRLIYHHLLHYAEPTHQRFIVRIIFMVPQQEPAGCLELWTICYKYTSDVLYAADIAFIKSFFVKGNGTCFMKVYAVMSFLSLALPDSAIYFNSIREIYDAWVIYNFFSLCLAWVGGPGAVVVSLSGQSLKPSWFLMTCCFPAIPLDGRFIRRCKQGCLQFVILKPILVVITFILYAKGKYADGNFSVNQSYLYITIIYTISYSMALFALALFYVACRDLLQPYNPVPKFIMVKSVVFLTYWQGVLVFLAAKSGFIKNAEKAAYLQNFVLCVEMLIAAIGHQFSFSYKEYAGSNSRPFGGFRGSLLHALKFNDFYHDTVHQFAPTYHEYVLYSNDGEDEPTKYSPGSIVPTGQDVELAEVTVVDSKAPVTSRVLPHEEDLAETMPSHVMEEAISSANPCDLSNLLDVEFSDYPSEVPVIPDLRKQ